MNLDNQLDILGIGWQGNEIAYWICDDITTNSWTKNVVTNQLVLASDARGKDIDLDDDIDIIAIGKDPGKLVFYLNNNFSFTEYVLNPDMPGAGGLDVVDLDQDGDQDIIAGSEIDGELYFYENTTIVGLEEPAAAKTSISVYPNPSAGTFFIRIPSEQSGPVQVKLKDLQGREIWYSEIHPVNGVATVSVQRLNGFFLVEVRLGDLHEMVKINLHNNKNR